MLRALACLSVLLSILSCALFRPPPATVEPPRDLYLRLERDYGRITSYKATGRLKFKAPGRRIAGRLFLAGRAPDNVRFEVTSLMGNTVWAAALHGSELFAFDGSTAVFYRGESTPGNIARLLGLPPAGPDDVFALAAARVVPEKVRLEAEGEGRFLLLNRYVIEFGPALLKELRPLRGNDFRLAFSGRADAAGVVFPGRLNIAYKNGTSLEIIYDRVELNPGVDEDLFTLVPPPGAGFKQL